MPKVSVNILTKNRKDQLAKAIESVLRQSFKDIEIIIVNDGSTDETYQDLRLKIEDLRLEDKLKVIHHEISEGIIKSRQEVLLGSTGDYIAILDDDDEWVDPDKLKKQVEFLDNHQDYVLVGGGIKSTNNYKLTTTNYRPETDAQIRNWMLLKNPFFTSTVMFRKQAAIDAGGFVKDEIDLGEDYDLWLRMGKVGKMYNFHEVFTGYAKTAYNREKKSAFLKKQLALIGRHKRVYPYYWLASLILRIRIWCIW